MNFLSGVWAHFKCVCVGHKWHRNGKPRGSKFGPICWRCGQLWEKDG